MAALVAVAAALRLYDLGLPSLGVDEGVGVFEAVLAAPTWRALPEVLRQTGEVHPPGWFLLLHGWAAFGTSEGWLRLSSALAGILAVPVTVWLGTELRAGRPGPAPVVAGLLLATSAWHGEYSRELRMYPLLGLLLLVNLAAFLRHLRTGGRSWLALAILAGGAAPWVHYFGLFGPLLTGLWVLRHRRDALGTWLAASGAALLLFAPWLPSLAGQFSAQDLGIRARPGWLALPELLGRMASADLLPSGSALLVALALGPAAFLVLALWRRRGLDPLLWLLVPPALAWGLSQFTPLRVFEFKYFVWTAPFLALVQGEVLDPPGRGARPALVAVLLVHLATWGALLFHPAAANQDWRAVASEILREAPEDAVVLVQPSMMAAPLLYYGVPPGRMKPLDMPTRESLQVLQGHRVVWLVSTPHHPLVVATGLEEALDRVLVRRFGRQRPDEGAWLPSAVIRVVRYEGERRPGAEQGGAR